VADDAPLLLDVTRLVWRRWVGRHPTGIDRVCLSYLEHFAPQAQAVIHHRYFRGIVDRHASQELFAILLEPPAGFRAALVKAFLRHLSGMRGKARRRLYLNIGHTGLDSQGFRAWVDRTGVRPVYFVHDLIPMTDPEYCRSGEDERHRARMRTVLSTASGVIGNSQSTLDELARFSATENLPYPPTLAAWLGETPFQPPLGPAEPDRPTFVVLGTIEARKNHLLLLNIWRRLVERLKADAPQLLIIGQRGWEAAEVCGMLDHLGPLSGHVIECGNCSDEEVALHLATARALLFPSKAEGFGLPLVEALRLGVPVIASSLPVFEEIGQGVPMLLDPSDEAAWETAIIDYAQPVSAARDAQLRRMASFRPPTWKGHLDAVENWLSTLL